MSNDGSLTHPPRLTGGLFPVEGPPRPYVLTINGGSSSLKFAVFAASDPIERVLVGRVERVGLGESRLTVSAGDGRRREDCAVEAPDQAAAAGLVLERLATDSGLARNAAGEPLISTAASTASVRVIPTDEETMIARDVVRLGVTSSCAPKSNDSTAAMSPQGADRWTQR